MSQKTNYKTEPDITAIPCDGQAEKYLLGNLLEKPELIPEVLGQLKTEEFFFTGHRKIYQTIRELHTEGEIIDFLAVPERLLKKEELDLVGGVAYIAGLIDANNRVVSVPRCIEKIKFTARKRKTQAANNRIAEMLSNGSDWQSVLGELNKTLEIANGSTEEEKFLSISEIAYSRLSYIEEISKREGELIGVTTGYRPLDTLTLGLQPANLIVLAARPGCGKSALALNIASNAAAKGKSIAFFSLEMSKNELVDRLICSIARVDLHSYKSAFLSKSEWARLGEALQEIDDYKITVEDSSQLTPSLLLSKALKIKKQFGLDLIIVDYLQLMQGDSKKEKRYEEVAQISHALKAIAKDLNVPVLALAQINRESEKRADYKPRISDLRESGDIEQDSDLILLLHRSATEPQDERYPTVNLLIEKHRNGPTGKIDFIFLKEFTRFEIKE